MGLIIVCNVGILKIPVARYLLGLPVPKESRLNGRIFGVSLFGILGLWYIRLLFNHVFIDRNLPQGLFELTDPREFIGLVIFVGAGFFIGYIVSVNMELRLAAHQNLETANESLERRVAERTAELTAVHQELVAHYEEMRLSQEILRDTNLYLENLINYANAPIIVWDPQFTITRFNHAFEFMTGRSEAEVLGQSLNMLFPPAYEAESMRLIHKTLAGERWETVEIAILHRDGSIRTVLWNSATLFAPDTHKPIATIAQGNDITERKKAEAALKSSQDRYQTLMKQSFEALALIDIEIQEIVEVNRRFTELLGYSLPEDSPLYVNKVVLDSKENLENRYGKMASQQQDLTVDTIVFRHKNGTVIYAERAGTIIKIDGRDYLLVSGRDMTAERLRQAELARNVEFARRVQRELLPELPDSPFVTIRTLYYPYNFVSADSYHLEWRREGKILRGFLIDVSGHGLATAIQTSSINVLLHEVTSAKLPLIEQLRRINARAAKYFTEGAYAAILGFELDFSMRELRYVGAGITQFYANARKIESPGMFVGMWADPEFTERKIFVEEGDSLCFLTDGFTDALVQPENAGLWSQGGRIFDADVTALERLAESGGLRDDATGICLQVNKMQ